MDLVKQYAKDSIDYHWSQTSLNGMYPDDIMNCLTPHMQKEVLDLLLENKGFTKNGMVKQEFIDNGYFHRKTCYGIRNGYEQELCITTKGLKALAATFKKGYISTADYGKYFEEWDFANVEKVVYIKNGKDEVKQEPTTVQIAGVEYTKYGDCLGILEVAKMIATESRIHDFMLFCMRGGHYIDRYLYPSEKAINDGILVQAYQDITVNYFDGRKGKESYPLTLVTPKGVKLFEEAWLKEGSKLTLEEILALDKV
jgi:hypothetical protein